MDVEDEFSASKAQILEALRSELTGQELQSGKGNPLLFDKALYPTAATNGHSSNASSISSDDIIVHTHEDILSSLTKQLQIQRQINVICEQDLQYRTDIIELLSNRITQLEAEALVWREQHSLFLTLKERVQYLEQREAAVEDDELYERVEKTYLEELRARLLSVDVDIENWRVRVATLEALLAEAETKSTTWQADIASLRETHSSHTESCGTELQELKLKIEELSKGQSEANTRHTELSALLETSKSQVAQLTSDLAAAEQSRNSALESASLEAKEFAALKERITNIEAQLEESQRLRTELQEEVQSKATYITERDNLLNASTTRQTELESALAESQSKIKEVENAKDQVSADAEKAQAELEEGISGAQDRIKALEEELSSIISERDNTENLVSILEARINKHEGEGRQSEKRILELEKAATDMSERISGLDSDLAASRKQFGDLKASSDALEVKLSESQAKAEDAVRLEGELRVVKENCQLHTAQLEKAQEALKGADNSSETLVETSARVAELEALLHAKQSDASGLEEKIRNAEEQIRDLETEKATHHDTLNLLTEQHSSSLKNLEGLLAGAVQERDTMVAEKDSLNQNLSALEAKVASLQEVQDTLKVEKEEALRLLDEARGSQGDALVAANERSKSLEEQIAASQRDCQSLQAQLAEKDTTFSDIEFQLFEKTAQAETATKRMQQLQAELDDKMSLVEQLELQIMAVGNLETQVDTLEKEREATASELKELNAKVSVLSTEAEELNKKYSEATEALESSQKLNTEHHTRIEELQKEIEDVRSVSKPAADESSLEELKQKHEQEIAEMESDFDAIRIERDELRTEKDGVCAERDKHAARIPELESRIKELESASTSASSSDSSTELESLRGQYQVLKQEHESLHLELEETKKSAGEMDKLRERIAQLESQKLDVESRSATPNAAAYAKSREAELEALLAASETKRIAAETSLLRQHSRSDSSNTASSHDSVIIVDSIDDEGNPRIHSVEKIGHNDAGSETGSDGTAEYSTMAASFSMASTTSSQAEFEAMKARAEQAEQELLRLKEQHGDEIDKGKRPQLPKHESSRHSIASALSSGFGEGHLFPGTGSIRSRKSSTHSHHSNHSSRDLSNPFGFLLGRDRKESNISHNSTSGTSSTSASKSDAPSPSKSTAGTSTTTSDAKPMTERERKSKEKAEKAEKELAEKRAKVEQEKARKAEKALKREQEKEERARKEKERKAQREAEGYNPAAMRGGGITYFEQN